MEGRNTNASQFEGVNALQKRIEELTKERDRAAEERDERTKKQEDSQTELLNEHSAVLAKMQRTLDLLVYQTREIPEITKRVTRLESWKAFVAGVAAAFTMIGGSIGYIVGMLVKQR